MQRKRKSGISSTVDTVQVKGSIDHPDGDSAGPAGPRVTLLSSGQCVAGCWHADPRETVGDEAASRPYMEVDVVVEDFATVGPSRDAVLFTALQLSALSHLPERGFFGAPRLSRSPFLYRLSLSPLRSREERV